MWENITKITGWGRYGSALFILLGSSIINGWAAPRTPVNNDEVLETLSISTLQNADEINSIRERFNNKPDDVELATKLATAYIQIARENTDVRYYGYAQAVLKNWWDEKHPPSKVVFLRAILKQQHHDFVEAANDLRQLLKTQPRHAQAWLALSIIQQVQGEYLAARASCSALARITSSWLSRVCHSQVLGLTGSAERAYQLQQVLALQVRSNQPELRQWILGLSAETANRLGYQEKAEKHFKEALAIPRRDAYLLRAYSDFLLANKRPAEILKLLKGETHDNALLLRLAIAAKNAHEKQLSTNYQQQLKSRYKAASLRNSKLHERDEALFLLQFDGDKKKALALALQNWKIQREPDDALILLRASILNQSHSGVKIIRDWVAHNTLQDVRLEKLLKRVESNDNV